MSREVRNMRPPSKMHRRLVGGLAGVAAGAAILLALGLIMFYAPRKLK